MVSNPILIIGNDVPHRAPAKIVKKTALLFVLNSELGNRFSSPPLRQATEIKRFCCFFEIIMAKKIKEKNPKKGIGVVYFIIALRSSSGVLIGIMLNFSTSTLSMFGVMNAGKLGPIRMSFIPR